MYRLICLIGLVGWAASLPAQNRKIVSPDGTRIGTRQVSLLSAVPEPCIALEAEDRSSTIVLSRNTVEWLASRDVDAVEDKISRMEFLASGRARELLASLAPSRDRFGCQRLSGEPSLETQFLK